MQDIGAGKSKKSTQDRRSEMANYADTHRLIEVTMKYELQAMEHNDHFWKEQWTLSVTCCFRDITPHINFQNRFIFPTSRMEECRIILAEQDNLLTFSELQDLCHLGLRWRSATPGENNHVERCSLKENTKKRSYLQEEAELIKGS
ncbi:hypothetical protein GQ457_07G009580 [Hibiscus cannabinus]